MQELIKRVEAANGADWQLSVDIFKATGGLHDVYFGSKVISWFGNGPFGCNTEDGVRHLHCINAPAYTGSLEAAMTLIPSGAVWTIEERCAWVRLLDNRDEEGVAEYQSRAETTALAVCAAALKALASR